ncbi:rRNA maturation RNase YbeY [Prolixibacteraceae bacterium JC049]|nr:rRNA maturation RNase YbeY [Prolixibacteraceae bacterium JC049]
MIEFYSEDIDFQLNNSELTEAWISKVIENHSFKLGDISFIFCTDDYLLNVNREYLQHDYYTDIITFDYVEDNVVSSDIFISIDRIKENAEEFKVSFENELNRIIIHGILHLLGFKDKEPEQKKIMTSKEDESLALLDELSC